MYQLIISKFVHKNIIKKKTTKKVKYSMSEQSYPIEAELVMKRMGRE